MNTTPAPCGSTEPHDEHDYYGEGDDWTYFPKPCPGIALPSEQTCEHGQTDWHYMFVDGTHSQETREGWHVWCPGPAAPNEPKRCEHDRILPDCVFCTVPNGEVPQTADSLANQLDGIYRELHDDHDLSDWLLPIKQAATALRECELMLAICHVAMGEMLDELSALRSTPTDN